MTSFTPEQIIIYFVMYSVLGWAIESTWCSIGGKKLVNRGFLSGPWCPIYGFGALFILSTTEPLIHYPLLIFPVSMLVASVLEYFTGWLMETLFHAKWWDYSNRKFNIKGRVCLRNSLLFGLLGVVLTYGINPIFQDLVSKIPEEWQRTIAGILVLIFVVDFIKSLDTATNLRQRVEDLRTEVENLKASQKTYSWFDPKDIHGSVERLQVVCKEHPEDKNLEEILERLQKLGTRTGSEARVLKAFPNFSAGKESVEIQALQQKWTRKASDVKANVKNWFHTWGEETKTAYKQLNATNLVWIFLVASLIGCVVETIFCFVTMGYVESRQGMIYGPFNQVYGFGALLMVLLLIPFAQKNNVFLFVGSAVVGGFFEAGCSLIQEYVFGSVSWEYSKEAISFFGGRTSLKFMFFWGLLGTIFMRWIYPKLLGAIGHLPKRIKRPLTIFVAVFLCVDMLISAAAVFRWSQRDKGIPATNAVEVFLDKEYPNDYLKKVYPSMNFVHDKSQS